MVLFNRYFYSVDFQVFYLIPIEPVFHLVQEICESQRVLWFVADWMASSCSLRSIQTLYHNFWQLPKWIHVVNVPEVWWMFRTDFNPVWWQTGAGEAERTQTNMKEQLEKYSEHSWYYFLRFKNVISVARDLSIKTKWMMFAECGEESGLADLDLLEE